MMYQLNELLYAQYEEVLEAVKEMMPNATDISMTNSTGRLAKREVYVWQDDTIVAGMHIYRPYSTKQVIDKILAGGLRPVDLTDL
jgi:hypothetical protein